MCISKAQDRYEAHMREIARAHAGGASTWGTPKNTTTATAPSSSKKMKSNEPFQSIANRSTVVFLSSRYIIVTVITTIATTTTTTTTTTTATITTATAPSSSKKMTSKLPFQSIANRSAVIFRLPDILPSPLSPPRRRCRLKHGNQKSPYKAMPIEVLPVSSRIISSQAV
jgi:hypothetical protein